MCRLSYFLKNSTLGSRETVQQLRVLRAPTEDLVFSLSTHMAAYKSITPVPGNPRLYSNLLGLLHDVVHTHILRYAYMQTHADTLT